MATLRRAAVAALAGAALCVAVAAVVDLAWLATASGRAAFRTWGPLATLLTLAGAVAVGLPAALAIEAVVARLGAGPLTALAGYLLAAAAAGAALVLAWAAFLERPPEPWRLAGELAWIAVGAALLWGGARLAERRGPAVVLAPAAGALVALAGASVALLA